jgi:hypothetical protein
LTTPDKANIGEAFDVSVTGVKKEVDVKINPDPGYATVEGSLIGRGSTTAKIKYDVAGTYFIEASARGYSNAYRYVHVLNPNTTAASMITIGDVIRPSSLPYQLPYSVSPGRTVDVSVTFPDDLKDRNDVVFEVVNDGDDDLGTATIEGEQPTTTGKLKIKGGKQTEPGSGGRLRIQAKVAGQIRGISPNGFSVCAHLSRADFSFKEKQEPSRFAMQTGQVFYYWRVVYNLLPTTDSDVPNDPDPLASLSELYVMEIVSAPSVKANEKLGVFARMTSETQRSFGRPTQRIDQVGIGIQTVEDNSDPAGGLKATIADDPVGLDSVMRQTQYIVYGCRRCGIPFDDAKPGQSPKVEVSGFGHVLKLAKKDGKTYLLVTKAGAYVDGGIEGGGVDPGNVSCPEDNQPPHWVELKNP